MTSAGWPIILDWPRSSHITLRAEPPHAVHVVRHQHERDAAGAQSIDPRGAFALEVFVADAERLVDHENVWLDVRRHRESQPQHHAGGIGAQRRSR